jgi:hypothetical protein
VLGDVVVEEEELIHHVEQVAENDVISLSLSMSMSMSMSMET